MHRRSASFTVEASLLMLLILPALLALLYLGFFLHDKGVLTGAGEEITARADLNSWNHNAGNSLSKQAGRLAKNAGASKNVSFSVSVSETQAAVSYTGSIILPGLLPRLFGKSTLSTGTSTTRQLLHPADLIRKIRGLEYVSNLLKE